MIRGGAARATALARRAVGENGRAILELRPRCAWLHHGPGHPAEYKAAAQALQRRYGKLRLAIASTGSPAIRSAAP